MSLSWVLLALGFASGGAPRRRADLREGQGPGIGCFGKVWWLPLHGPSARFAGPGAQLSRHYSRHSPNERSIRTPRGPPNSTLPATTDNSGRAGSSCPQGPWPTALAGDHSQRSPQFFIRGNAFAELPRVPGWQVVRDEDQDPPQFGRVRAAPHHSAAALRVPQTVHRIVDETAQRRQRFRGGTGPQPVVFQTNKARASPC